MSTAKRAIPDFSFYFEATFCKIVRNPIKINKTTRSTSKNGMTKIQ